MTEPASMVAAIAVAPRSLIVMVVGSHFVDES
jgi:hypothetical protein